MTQLHFNNMIKKKEKKRVDNFTCSCSLGVLKEKPMEGESQKGNVEESNPKFDQRLTEGKRKIRKQGKEKRGNESSENLDFLPPLSATCLYSIPLFFSSLSPASLSVCLSLRTIQKL